MPVNKLDEQELIILRQENKELCEMIDSLKSKLQEKTIECNKAKKKLNEKEEK
jgi:hypothetical protein